MYENYCECVDVNSTSRPRECNVAACDRGLCIPPIAEVGKCQCYVTEFEDLIGEYYEIPEDYVLFVGQLVRIVTGTHLNNNKKGATLNLHDYCLKSALCTILK